FGFSDGAANEAARLATALARHRAEATALVRVFRDEAVGAVVYENRNALPRAFRVATIEPAATVETALGRLAEGFDFRIAALVTASPATMAAAEEAASDAVAAHGGDADRGAAAAWGGTTVVKDDPQTVIVATDGAARGLLVLADLDYPGWRATVD